MRAIADGAERHAWRATPSAPRVRDAARHVPAGRAQGLRAVADEGAVSLIWDANTEADLGGYLVLRGDGPVAHCSRLRRSRSRTTTYRDTTVMPGVRYVYAVVAVDAATPARNISPPSPQEEVTAR